MGKNQLLSLFISMIIHCPRVNQWEFLQIGCMSLTCHHRFVFWALLYFMALQDAPSSSSVSCPSPGTSHLTKVSFSKGYSETKIWLYVFSLLMGRPLFLSPLSRQSWQKHIEMCVCVSTIHISISISIHIFFKP